tara:strand:- start:268 stop:480 length:213 start_codon:yes stop_codon:yes gene_type:complete
MSLIHLHSRAAKFGLASLIISVLHFFEDAALVLLGRYTTINIWIAVAAGIIFSVSIAGLYNLKIIKRYLT